MNFIKKYIVPMFFILFGCAILNWIFSKIAINYIVPIVNKILIILTLQDSIIYWFSEIIIFAILGVISFIIVIFCIQKINKDLDEIPFVSIFIPLIYRVVFWGIHFSLIYESVLAVLKSAPLQVLNIIITLVTIDIVFFALFLFQRKNLFIKK